jgi:hypothetical protein
MLQLLKHGIKKSQYAEQQLHLVPDPGTRWRKCTFTKNLNLYNEFKEIHRLMG